MPGEDRPPVSVLGLGMMGSALAGSFLNGGHPTTVWNRSAEKADPLVRKGATRVATVAEAASASPIVVVCVSDYQTVREVLDPVGDAISGRVVVNLTSGTPEQAREAAGWAARLGADYLDGAIMAVPPMIGRPEALVFYGGAVFEAHRPALTTLGGRATYLGPGMPLSYDLALLGMLWSSPAGYLHALALLRTANVGAKDFLPYARAWFENVISPGLPDVARAVDEGDYATDVSSLDVNRAAIAHLIEASEAQDIGADVMLPILAMMERRVAEGHGADGLASLIEALKRTDGRKNGRVAARDVGASPQPRRLLPYATRSRGCHGGRRAEMDDKKGQVEGFVEEWAAAEQRGDATFLRDALTDDFVGVGPAGFVLTKEQWLGRFAGGLAYESLAFEEVDARLYGEVAVLTARQKQAGTFQGNDVGGEFRATIVLVERGGRWLLAGWHGSPIAGVPSFLNR